VSNSTLTDDDRTLLAALEGDPATAEGLAARVDRPADELVDRLDFMADNGLLRRADGGYALTDGYGPA
jgi:predicted transcriptional regulator